MSRITYYEDEDGTYPIGLWEGAMKRAISGRRGQAVLREVESALLALPNKRLIESKGAAEGDVCVLGALDWHRLVQAGMAPDVALTKVTEWAEDALYNPREAANHLSITHCLSFALMEENDEMASGETPEERYESVLKAVRGMIRANDPAR